MTGDVRTGDRTTPVPEHRTTSHNARARSRITSALHGRARFGEAFWLLEGVW